MSASNRGKFAEKKLREMCVEFAKSANFAFHRFPDAHAGSMVTAPADFQTLYDSQMRLIEVKETEELARLPYKNFAPDQVARMRLWKLAGAESWVIIYHTESKFYRCFEVEPFLDRPAGSGSWFFEDQTKSGYVAPRFQSEKLLDVFKFIHGM